MKKLAILIFLFSTIFTTADESHLWYRFQDTTKNQYGFKDINGKIMIEPDDLGFVCGRKFDKIVAVEDYQREQDESYYLTKSGKKVGKGNIYYYDNTPDCESEGFIRFHDRQNDMIGLLNQDGEIAIPSEYNALSRVYNGLVVALKGAKKVPVGEYYIFEGGKNYLLDSAGRILIEEFDTKSYLNFYSLQIELEPLKDTIRVNFRGVNGKYYSFIDYDKEIQAFLDSLISKDISEDDLAKICHDSLSFYAKEEKPIYKNKSRVIKSEYKRIVEKLYSIKSKNSDYFVSHSTNLLVYQSDEGVFAKYFNNCREVNEMKYPFMSIIINNKIDGDIKQDHIDFLRTEGGYKLISVSIS